MSETNQERNARERAEEPREPHRYDSFVVRLWSRGEEGSFGRAEVQHVQSDVVSSGTMVDLDWVGAEMKRLLEPREGS